MVEAAYQLKLLPMAFVGIDKSISISEEQKKAVKAMFCYDAFLDLDVYKRQRIYWRIGFGVEVVKRKDEYFSR